MPPLDRTHDSRLYGVAMDLARDPEIDWAVINEGCLLPMRFGTSAEAWDHLMAIRMERAAEERGAA